MTFSSAFGVRVEITDPVLFDGVGSGVEDEALAVLVIEPVAAAETVPETVTVTADGPPTAISPRAHDLVANVHVPADVVIDAAVKPTGNESDN